MPTPPRKPKNKSVRSREYLTPDEVAQLIKAAKSLGRHSHRDATMILTAYRHGLRVSELVNLHWQQIDWRQGQILVNRQKNSVNTLHPMLADEIRALRKLKRDYSEQSYVFVTERQTPVSDSTFRKLVARAGVKAGLLLPVHPHMLRHATGFKLANDGHDTRSIQLYLGHKNIQHTVRYTELTTKRFEGFW